MSKKTINEEALDYHALGRPGKIEVVPTKATSTQKDLSLAYSPGVAAPCLELQAIKMMYISTLVREILLL